MKTTRPCRKLLFGNKSSHALFAQVFKGEREYICFKNFSEYEVKQNLTWRELFAIQFALQSFAPKISNKSVCWETENSAASLTVTSESNNTGSPDLLDTQSYKTFKNIQSQSILVVYFWHSASS